jgi:outer membrane protein OmpA-like peptidoglycan-associated protein
MVDRTDIQDGMEVVGSDGAHVGRVLDVESNHIVLGRGGIDGSSMKTVSVKRVDRVEDGRVHLIDSAAVTLGGFGAAVREAVGDPTAATPHDPVPPTRNRVVEGARPRGNYYLPWIVGLIGLLALFGLYYRYVKDEQADTVGGSAQIERGEVSPVGATQALPLPNGRQVTLTPGALEFQVRQYLVGTDATPRRFEFERLNFPTGSAAIPADARPSLETLGQVLAAYPDSRVQVTGHADARGSAPANQDLGLDRAKAVAALLAANGVEPTRIEVESGGEAAPAAPNVTAPGRAENRRTELTVALR